MGQDISQMYLRTDRFQRIYSLSAPTLGFNIQTIAHKKYKLNIWDVGGQKSIRGYWRNYYEKTVPYDLSNHAPLTHRMG